MLRAACAAWGADGGGGGGGGGGDGGDGAGSGASVGGLNIAGVCKTERGANAALNAMIVSGGAAVAAKGREEGRETMQRLLPPTVCLLAPPTPLLPGTPLDDLRRAVRMVAYCVALPYRHLISGCGRGEVAVAAAVADGGAACSGGSAGDVASQVAGGGEGAWVFVGSLPDGCTFDELRELFVVRRIEHEASCRPSAASHSKHHAVGHPVHSHTFAVLPGTRAALGGSARA